MVPTRKPSAKAKKNVILRAPNQDTRSEIPARLKRISALEYRKKADDRGSVRSYSADPRFNATPKVPALLEFKS